MGTDGLTIIKGTLDLLALKSLAAQGRQHGFEILDWLRRHSGGEIDVQEGALYPALHRMERRGLLQGEWGISEKGRRARYYDLTPAGRAQLDERAAQWDRYVRAVARLDEATAP